jgi:hypothetical protein
MKQECVAVLGPQRFQYQHRYVPFIEPKLLITHLRITDL